MAEVEASAVANPEKIIEEGGGHEVEYFNYLLLNLLQVHVHVQTGAQHKKKLNLNNY